MFKKFIWLLLISLVALSAAALVFTGCGGDDDDDDTGDDDTGDDDTGDDDTDDDDDTGGPGTLSAFVNDFQTSEPVAQAMVEVLQNDSGLEFDPAIVWFSENDGSVTIDNIPDGVTDVAIRTSKGDYRNTLQYGFPVGATGEEFLIVSNVTASLIFGLLGVTDDPADTHIAGAVYWGDPSDETEIGCAVVTTDPVGPEPIHYATGSKIPTTSRDAATPANSKGTNPGNGIFTSLGMTPGAYDITATPDGVEEETVSLPMAFANTICIQNVYFSKADYPTNPMAAFCTE
ncbi:MAG: hypothetical protein P9M14_01180 [Candidatus Alcyoniella australis]|nr:hypothetical protein [Candidatus Alcyoniella australis]